jgi:hypothetical protein
MAVIYSVESNFYGGARPEDIANNPENVVSGTRPPFWDACDRFADARQPYDVRFLAEGTLRTDSASELEFGQYRVLLLPECHTLTEPQADGLLQFLDDGGAIVATGTPGVNLDDSRRRALVDHPQMTIVEDFSMGTMPVSPQVSWHTDTNLAVNIVQVERGAAIHIIRYDHDDVEDIVPTLPVLEFSVRLDGEFDAVSAFAPGNTPHASMVRDGDIFRVRLQDVPLYSIVLLEGANA